MSDPLTIFGLIALVGTLVAGAFTIGFRLGATHTRFLEEQLNRALAESGERLKSVMLAYQANNMAELAMTDATRTKAPGEWEERDMPLTQDVDDLHQQFPEYYGLVAPDWRTTDERARQEAAQKA